MKEPRMGDHDLRDTLLERLEAENRLQLEMKALRDDYLERHPGEECVVCVMGTPGPTAALYVGPLIHKQKQQPLDLRGKT